MKDTYGRVQTNAQALREMNTGEMSEMIYQIYESLRNESDITPESIRVELERISK